MEITKRNLDALAGEIHAGLSNYIEDRVDDEFMKGQLSEITGDQLLEVAHMADALYRENDTPGNTTPSSMMDIYQEIADWARYLHEKEIDGSE